MELNILQEPLEERLVPRLGPLYECSEWRDGIRIRTPFTFPCGQIINVFCKINECRATITDYGDTLGWLSLQCEEPIKSEDRLMRFIDEINKTRGVKIQGHMLYIPHAPESNLADEVIRMLQAMLAISNLYYILPHIESQLIEK